MITQRIRSVDHYVMKQNISPSRSANSSSQNKCQQQSSSTKTYERVGPLTMTSSGPSRKIATTAMATELAQNRARVDPTFLIACRRSEEGTLRTLIHKRPSVHTINQQDKTGRTGLSHVCSDAHMAVLCVLSELAEIDVNLADTEGNTPLMLAAQAGHVEVVSFLLDKFRSSINVDQRNHFGLTALMKSSLQGRARCAKQLLTAGANPMLRDPGRRYTALEWAKYCGRQSCIETLEKYMKNAPKRFSTAFETKLMSSASSSRSRRTSESELASECMMSKHSQLSKSDSDNGWLRQKLRKTLRCEPKSRKNSDLGPLGNMTATAMMCASSAIFPSMEPVSPSPGEYEKRGTKPLPLLVPKVEITHAPQVLPEVTEMNEKSEKHSGSKRKKN